VITPSALPGSVIAAFGVHIGGGFFGIGRAGQHHIGAGSATVAMRADIGDERARRDVDLVGAEQDDREALLAFYSGAI
jgi:hypothetical protein